MDALQRDLQLLDARRPQDRVRTKGNDLSPVLHRGPGARARIADGVARGHALTLLPRDHDSDPAQRMYEVYSRANW